MKKRSFVSLALLSLALSACSGMGTPTPDPEPIDAPVISLNNDKNGIVWSEVEDASGYEFKVNDEVVETEGNSYSFSRTNGTYNIALKAISAVETKLDSEVVTYSYETLRTALESLSISNGTITWSGLVGLGIEVKFGANDYVAVSGDSYIASEEGTYSFRPVAGFDEGTNKYYIDNNVEKSILVANPASEALVIESGDQEDDATLQEEYTCKKFGDSNSWEATGDYPELSDMNAGISDGKCVKYNFHRHGIYFRFDKAIEINGSMDTLSFYLKGDDVSTVVLIFEITQETSLAGMNLVGTYLSYTIDVAESCWKKYTISMNDPGWKVDFGGTKKSTAEVLDILASTGLQVSTICDLLPLFSNFSLRAKATPNENWGMTAVYLDEITLSNTGAVTEVEKMIALSQYYSVSSENGLTGSLKNNGDGTGKLSVTKEENNYSFDVTIEKTKTAEAIIRYEDGEKNFTYTGLTSDSGYTFKAVDVQGSDGLVELLSGMELETADIYYVDDFESYAKTGVGYDKNHSADSRSDMRENYYSDYYDGNAGSPLGGNGWSLMGSSDYLDLSTSEAHTGSKSMKFKYNSSCAMRAISYSLYAGSAPSIGKGTTFSFWAKGTTHDINLKARVYYVNKVGPSNQTIDSTLNDQIKIPANSDWTEYTVSLDASKTYYGFSFTTVAKYDSNAYFHIDDICIYGAVSPWGK